MERVILNTRYANKVNDRYIFNINTALRHKYAKLLRVVIPLSYYNVDSDNNTITVGGTTITVTPGQYRSGTSLASQLQTAIRDGTSDTNYSVTFSTTTNKLTFTHSTTPFVIDPQDLSEVIGISATTSSATSHTSDETIELDANRELYFRFNNMTGSNTVIDASNTSYTFSIPVSTRLGEVMMYEPTHPLTFKLNNATCLTNANFGVYNYLDNIIDFNSSSLTLEFELYD